MPTAAKPSVSISRPPIDAAMTIASPMVDEESASRVPRAAGICSLMSEQMPAARGTLLALSSSTIGLAIVIAASIGGLLIDTLGFAAVGIYCVVAALASALVVVFFVREAPMDIEIASA